MTWISNLWQRLHKRRAELDAELDDELAHHIALKQQDLERDGLAPEEARAAAYRSLGNATLVKADTRDLWSFTYLESLWTDVAYSFRLLRKDAIFSSVALLTLAIGIGANTAIFSLLNGLVWKTLPVEHPDELVRLALTNLPPTDSRWATGLKSAKGRIFTYPLFESLAKRQQVFTAVFGTVGGGAMQFDVNGMPYRERATILTGALFSGLKLQPQAGRLLSEQDDIPGAPPAVIISDALWTRLFARSSTAIGTRVFIESVPFTIAGVVPAAFKTINTGSEVDLWITLSSLDVIYPQVNWRHNPAFPVVQPMARLRPGVTIEQARQQLKAISRAILEDSLDPQLSSTDAQSFLALKIEPIPAPSGLPWMNDQYGPTLWILLAAAGAVLLIAVTNLTNLFLARAAARRHEMALRLSLGAPAARIRRQLMLESSLIAAAGVALGILWARWLVALFETVATRTSAAMHVDTSLDWRIFAFLSGVLMVVVVIAGLIPAFSVSRVAPQEMLQKRSGGSRSLAFRRSLIVLQTAFSLALLGGAGLMLTSLRALVEQDMGFQVENSAELMPDLLNAGISRERMPRAYATLLAAIREQPNVVAAAWNLVSRGIADNLVDVPGRPDLPQAQRLVYYGRVSNEYFSATGIPILAGTDLPLAGSRTDLCLISANAALKFFESPQGAVGQRLKLGGKTFQIVGVVGDAKFGDIRDAAPMVVYAPYGSNPPAGLRMAIRYRGPFQPVLSSLEWLFQKEAGRRPWIEVRTIRDDTLQALAPERLLTWLLTGFAAFAVLISVIGLFGLLSYSVEQRRKEFGIRVALGASPARIRWEVQFQGISLTAAGLLLGIALSLALRRSLDAYLYHVAATDPMIWTAGIAALLLTGLAASAFPASRAARIDPIAMLRDE